MSFDWNLLVAAMVKASWIVSKRSMYFVHVPIGAMSVALLGFCSETLAASVPVGLSFLSGDFLPSAYFMWGG